MENYKALGFTLIEVLVVTAMIAILSSVVIIGVQKAQEKASDAVETRNLTQVKTALELYYNEEKEYVIDTTSHPSNCSLDGGTVCTNCSMSEPDEFLKQLENKGLLTREQILTMFGEDVGNPKLKACYYYSVDLQRYKWVAILYGKNIMKNDSGISDDFYETGNDLNLPFDTSPGLYQ